MRGSKNRVTISGYSLAELLEISVTTCPTTGRGADTINVKGYVNG